MNNTWIEETLELIKDWENEYSSITTKMEAFEERIEELEEERSQLEERMMAAQALIQTYREKHK